ncbi:MAG: nitrous oxide reductase family maturation protein NosD [Campylobacteraceae bacterium]|jgi:nitrous oxidase accessory protein|nr:nitrous oxide reductase family maturation protein NosD [Campylobacteraceae bacterium]
MKYLILFIFALSLNANPLQQAIDSARAGSKIELGRGEYRGNIIISKPLIIEGAEDKSAKIMGDNNGSVITITSSNVMLKNLRISGSGSAHEGLDAAVLVKDAANVVLENNEITDSLFGINFQKVSNSKIISNVITSKQLDLGARGDGIVFWYSHENLVKGNRLYKSRDIVAWYSSKNIYENNFAYEGRYSLHFMYANDNLVQNNVFERNSVGIFFMYSHDITARNNTIKNSSGVFGVGLGLKDSSNFIIEDNSIIYNARGIFLDQSPYIQGSVNIFRRNNILYNANAVQFMGSREKSFFSENSFKGNMELVSSDMIKNDAAFVEWRRNYWDGYEGFDRNGDGVGDIPYKQFVYADKLWSYNENIRFFYGTAAMGLLNFLAKLAPFSQPELMVVDNEPLVRSAI